MRLKLYFSKWCIYICTGALAFCECTCLSIHSHLSAVPSWQKCLASIRLTGLKAAGTAICVSLESAAESLLHRQTPCLPSWYLSVSFTNNSSLLVVSGRFLLLSFCFSRESGLCQMDHRWKLDASPASPKLHRHGAIVSFVRSVSPAKPIAHWNKRRIYNGAFTAWLVYTPKANAQRLRAMHFFWQCWLALSECSVRYART